MQSTAHGTRALFGLAAVLALVLGAMAGAIGPAESVTSAATKLDPQALALAEREGTAQVFVQLVEQADTTPARAISDKVARTTWVYRTLREVADRTQPPLVRWLAERGVSAESFFIVNMLAVEADAATLHALARRSDVAYVEWEGTVDLIEPVEPEQAAAMMAVLSPQLPAVVERGVKTIKADKVWKMGYKGEGIVVAITDTGVNHRHPALKDQYRGADGDHDYNWFDAAGDSETPVDVDSHGTHVTGTAVGEAGARQIGVAPEAKWIACRLIERRSSEGDAGFRCLQWAIAPTKVDDREQKEGRPEMAPDVVNASWGSRPGQSCAGSAAVRRAVQSLTNAGILFVSSAGNSGNKCSTICAPATYEESWSVANYDMGRRNIYQTSSRGPVEITGGELIKPDIAAPGVEINSSIPPSRYDKKSGTSMAAPHVTGAVALLLSARPEFRGRTDLVRDIFEQTASSIRPDKCGPSGAQEFNNSAGHGLIDVEAAVELALTATIPPPTPTLTPPPTSTRTPTATTAPTGTPTATSTPAPRFDIYTPIIGRRWNLRR